MFAPILFVVDEFAEIHDAAVAAGVAATENVAAPLHPATGPATALDPLIQWYLRPVAANAPTCSFSPIWPVTGVSDRGVDLPLQPVSGRFRS